MDLTLSPTEKAFRDEFRAWLEANLPEPFPRPAHSEDPQYEGYLRNWQRKLFEGGWSGLTWPKAYGGRGATPIEQAIFVEEMARANAPEIVGFIGIALIGPSIIVHGTEEHKKAYLAPMLSGEKVWCQGFSEPNAGSDVASLTTRAVLDGDHYVVNGQKTWTSYAQISDYCFLLVRTDPEAGKHKGITGLMVDMKSEGISVRPLRMMSGDSSFNEIFFTDVRVPVSQVLGKVNEGWGVAITALMNERANLGGMGQVMLARFLDGLIATSRKIPRPGGVASDDPLVRQKIAQAHLELEVFRTTAARALSQFAKRGIPGPEGSFLKMFWTELNQRTARSAMEIAGPYGQLTEGDMGTLSYSYLRSRGNTIEAGTSEILRNIIAQRVLGLPKSY